MVKPVLLKSIQIEGQLTLTTTNLCASYQHIKLPCERCRFLQASPTLLSVSHVDPAGSARRLAPPPASRVPATPSPLKGRPRARVVLSAVSHVCTCRIATAYRRPH